VGTAILDIVTGSGSGEGQDAYLLTAAGLSPAP
jgi:hypothetical protein